MQIHELDTYTGNFTNSVYFAVDDGTETNKVPSSSVVTPMSAFRDYFYPVGSYYETSDTSFNPNTAWGGTWVKETAGQVHVSAGTGYSVNGANSNITDGGEATHTLTINEMPSHAHGCGLDAYGSLTGSAMKWGYSTSRGVYDSGYDIVLNTGGGQAHNNMPPYIVVNRWHRTA